MLIYGKNVVKEVINNKIPIKRCFLYDKFNDNDIINYLKQNSIMIKYLSKNEMDKKVDVNHQGIIMEIDDYKYFTTEEIIKDGKLIVILDHLEDPHNFGAIIRTCEAAKVDGIIIPKDRSVDVNSTVIKVSTGAAYNIKIAREINLKTTIDKLKKVGFWIIGTDMQGEAYTKIDYSGKVALVIGNEGSGMSRLVKESCDFIASIPMYGKVNSLNASVAAGIFIFEAIKERI